ncbi:MAG: hypothetical protein BWY74_03311 [Firmicutes bacterium ADurb.Bin419]|nr:MAG: hypothetical protein BWY74_03311 [Firmicutes bacterium ADurb.Bin419]
MRDTIKVLALCLCIVFLSSCTSNEGNDKKEIDKDAISNVGVVEDIAESPKKEENSLVGVYKYDNENDSKDLVEDHYIIIEFMNDRYYGRYYGTSDDFDTAREGYYPGFFVSEMRDLVIENDEIEFSIKLQNSDVFSKPVDLRYKTSNDVPNIDNPIWENSHIIEVLDRNPRVYKGKIDNSKIILEIDNEIRTYNHIM